MQKWIIPVTVVIVLLGACASGKDTAQSASVGQQKVSAKSSTPSLDEKPLSGSREVQDSQIMDLSKVDTTEQSGWIDPKNPPELKRKYQKGHFSVVLPEDLYPVKTSVYSSAALFKFSDRDALLYVFSPQGTAGSAFLDVNLNTLDLNLTNGYQDMSIDLKAKVLKMTYRLDGSPDGYLRYVEIGKTYQPAAMQISVLLVRDPQSYNDLQQKYRAVLSTLKHEN
jgi:hypothetical protein